MSKDIKLSAKWTDDCQGKKDYDGNIVCISTRYWPRGGGFMLFDPNADKKIQDNEDRPEIKPSAHSSICLVDGGIDENVPLIEKEFEAETEDEVKESVEKWAAEEMKKIVDTLRNLYPTPTK